MNPTLSLPITPLEIFVKECESQTWKLFEVEGCRGSTYWQDDPHHMLIRVTGRKRIIFRNFRLVRVGLTPDEQMQLIPLHQNFLSTFDMPYNKCRDLHNMLWEL